jgi:uncharacterized delta-60 repeat protein
MDTRRLTVLATVFAVGIGASAWVRAAPGDLDATFGEAGLVRLDIDGDSDRATSIVAQGDGKLLVGRGNDLDSDDFSVLRFNADGTLDSSFDADGRTSLDIPGGHGSTNAVLQQSDGSIVAAGGGAGDLALVRYLTDGRIDTSFGADGVIHYDMAARAALQQSDGKLVVAGYLNPACLGCWDDDADVIYAGMALARFDTVGVIDVGFGVAGATTLDSLIDLRGLVEQPDGKLLVVGSAWPRGIPPLAMTVHRLTRDGELDPTFGNAGVVTIAFVRGDGAQSDAYGAAIALQSDGKIVVAGTANFQCCIWTDSTGDLALARLNPDGSLDETFGSGGRVLYDHGASETIDQGGLVIEPDGTIVVAGHRSIVETGETGLPTYGLLARFTADGLIDSSFGQQGVTLIDVGYDDSVSDASAHGIVGLPDGSIVAAFTASASEPDSTMVVARLAAGGGPGVIGFTRNAVSVAEGHTATIVVKRTGAASGAVSVEYGTYVGSVRNPNATLASAGADFAPTAGTLTWPDGDMSDRVIVILTAADAVTEPDETFLVRLFNPTGGAGLATASAEVTILSQLPTPTVAPSPSPLARKSGGGASGVLETLFLGLLVGWTRVRKSRTGTRGSSGPRVT